MDESLKMYIAGTIFGISLGNLGRMIYDDVHIKSKYESTPVQIEMKDLNKDGLTDRVITLYKGEQIQYQIVEDSTPHFYTYDQLQELNKTKYSIDTTVTESAADKH